MTRFATAIALSTIALGGCGSAPYSPDADARIMRQFYLECRKAADQNFCIIALRDEFFWALGENLEFAVTGEVAR